MNESNSPNLKSVAAAVRKQCADIAAAVKAVGMNETVKTVLKHQPHLNRQIILRMEFLGRHQNEPDQKFLTVSVDAVSAKIKFEAARQSEEE